MNLENKGALLKHSATHTYRGHQSSLISFLHLSRSMSSSVFNPRTWQSFCTISLQVFFGLPLGLAPPTWYSVHFFTQSSSSFCNIFPYHRNLFCCSTEIRSSNLSLSLNYLLGNGTLSCSFTVQTTHPSNHSHLCPLECHLIFVSYRPGLTSVQHTTSNTTAVQSPSQFQWYVLIRKQWYQLPEFIPSISDSVLHSCISISIHTQHVT